MKEGVYVAPRAPTNNWNLWHEGHIDPLFDRLIEDMIVFEDVNPNRVYLTGYSAGGDGVYQLAPRMADRFAAAAMMAGHPNEASPLGLRNLPFAIHMGAKDSAYKRNEVAKEWGEKLKALRDADAAGYEHYVKLHEGRGHWMEREDAEALPWMANFTRQTFPKKIVWRQDDILGARFYWLATSLDKAQAGQEIQATLDGQSIDVTAPADVPVRVRLCDAMLDMDKPVTLRLNKGEPKTVQPTRTIAMMQQSLQERSDPTTIFSYELALAP
jgi:dienelactone hydrolase